MKMKIAYAEGFLTKGYAGHWKKISCHDNLLVIEDLEDYAYCGFLGTALINGILQTDAQGYVVFSRVEPIITKETRWKF